jgi:hypothetical protein
MSNNLPRRPVRFVEQNEELLKSQEGLAGQRQGATDFSEDQPVAQISRPTAQYRTPIDRVSGNEFFRRYLSGELDMGYAVSKVVDAIHRAKDGGGVDQLNNEEKTCLSILFPQQFHGMDNAYVSGTIAAVQLRIQPEEIAAIRVEVAKHVQEEMNYNAGRGGGSAPGRHQTRS